MFCRIDPRPPNHGLMRRAGSGSMARGEESNVVEEGEEEWVEMKRWWPEERRAAINRVSSPRRR
jgi:hypothetical protein